MRLNVRIPISYLLVLLHTLCCRKRKFKYEVSLCLIFKDEAPYLKEWIEYHRLIGVEHFYLYYNFSSDNYQEVLAPYIDKGIVTLTEWPYTYAQSECYHDCYQKAKDETHWLGFIDADEFVNLIRHNDIKDFLKRYSAYPSVSIYWRIFGTSGIIKEPLNELQTERYTATWPYLHTTGKSFINNNYREFAVGVHYSAVKTAGFQLNPIDDRFLFGIQFRNAYVTLLPYSPKAYINHYYTRSYEFIQYKCLKRSDVARKQFEEIKKVPKYFERFDLPCSVHDYSIQRWLTLLKLRMNREG